VTIPEGVVYCVNCGSRVKETENIPAPVVETQISEAISEIENEVPINAATVLSPPSVPKKIAKATLSVVLSIFLFIFLFILVVLTIVNPSNIPQITATADITFILDEIGLLDDIVDGINSSRNVDIKVDIYSLKDFLERSNVSDEVGKIAQGYATAITDGDFDYYLSEREIVNFLRTLSADIRDEFDYRLTSSDFDSISETLYAEANLRNYRISNLMDDAGVDLTTPYILLSMYTLIIIGFLNALLIFNIIMLHKSKVRIAFLNIGITISVLGLALVAFGVLIGFFSGLFSKSDIYSIIRLVSGFARIFLIPGLIVLLLGCISIVLFFFIRSYRKKHPPKELKKTSTKIWRNTVLITNLATVFTCCVLAVLLLMGLQ
jgi:uncharacterized membrane protein